MIRRLSKSSLICSAAILFLLLWSLAAHAAVPQTINYQGYLTNSSGQPVNGQVSMTFKLYDAASGGTALWAEAFSAVQVNNGVYSVILGSANPINLTFDTQYYLGVTIGYEDPEMSPRQALTSTPYAFSAIKADTVTAGSITDEGISSSANISSSKISGLGSLATKNTIADADIDSGATIADTKLATISTSGKVSDSALSSNVALLNNAQTISGAKTFSSQIASTVPTGTAPLQVASTTSVTNLNADLLDGQLASDIILIASIEGTSCNDEDLCTENDKYVNGQCAGTLKNCDDGLNFTIDSCNSGTGQCLHTNVLCYGQNCDDGNSCTNDGCEVSGCVHSNNSYSTSCYTGSGGTLGVGNCSAGTKTCSGGSFGACIGQILPVSETCGGGDEDCDGLLNEENAAGCTFYRKDIDGDGHGINDTKCLCAPEKKHDSDSTTYKYYTAPNTGTYDCNDSNHHINPGATEVCGNVIDDNCNGQTDENCTINADAVDGKSASDLKILLATSSSSSSTKINATCTNHQSGVVTINVTGPGTIVVDGNAWVAIEHFLNTKDTALIAIGTTNTDCGANEDRGVITIPSAYPTLALDNSVHVNKSLHVTSSGDYTFYLNGLMLSGQSSGDEFYYSNMRAVFYPD